MKYIFCLAILYSQNSCHLFEKREVVMGNYVLPNGNVITLKCIGTGATAPDVVWIHESLKDSQVIVGKIKSFNDMWKVNVYHIDNNHIKIRFTDAISVRGGFRDFIIDLNNRITMNDGSPYNE